MDSPTHFKVFKSVANFYSWANVHFKKQFYETMSESRRKEDNLKLLKIIGSGAFGVVAIGTLDGKTCAVKIFDKQRLIKTKQVERTIYEKNILSSIVHPNIVRFMASFKDNSSLYIVMSAVVGGELFTHLRRVRRFGESITKQIAAQIVLAFEYLQLLGIAHRDIKPENILMERSGYVKLTDFGFAKVIKARTFTLCGTPEYLAPEVILQRGYGLSVDWWGVGILIYELSSGFTPFFAYDHSKIYDKVLKGAFKMPESFSPELKDLIQNLIQRDPSKRFGCMKDGTTAIKNHAWFADIDWWSIFIQEVNMKFKPKVKDDSDLSNFETSKVSLKEASEDIHASLFAEF